MGDNKSRTSRMSYTYRSWANTLRNTLSRPSCR